MTLERRTEALLELVESDRRTHCEAIASDADSRARALLAQAHAGARARMRDAFAEERRRADERLAAARAELATRRRHAEQRRAAALLTIGMSRLPDALRHHWHDDAARGAWVDAVVESALRVLPRTSWRIVHPVDWSTDEQRAAAARVATALDAAPEFIADPGVEAGLRISAAGNVVDGTLVGLITDRNAIGARLLGLLEESP